MDEEEIQMLAEQLGIDPAEVLGVVDSIEAFEASESALDDVFGDSGLESEY